jgi:creatinine amidohydrolase/Fe(II)-dependent formamide hydrolase-like protein
VILPCGSTEQHGPHLPTGTHPQLARGQRPFARYCG